MLPFSDTSVRNAVRALIVRDGQILLLRKYDPVKGERFALPGGSQELGETLQQALSRECLEEIGVDVTILALQHVADYFKPRSTEPPTCRQMVEFIFRCAVAEDYVPHNGHRPDRHQLEVLWVALDRLAQLPLPPDSMRPLLADEGQSNIYVGTID